MKITELEFRRRWEKLLKSKQWMEANYQEGDKKLMDDFIKNVEGPVNEGWRYLNEKVKNKLRSILFVSMPEPEVIKINLKRTENKQHKFIHGDNDNNMGPKEC